MPEPPGRWDFTREHAGLPDPKKQTNKQKNPTAELRRSSHVISLLKVREKGKDEVVFPWKRDWFPSPKPTQQGVLEELGSLSAPGPEGEVDPRGTLCR